MEGAPNKTTQQPEVIESKTRSPRETLLQVLQSEETVHGSGQPTLSPEQRTDVEALLSSTGTSFDDPALAHLDASQVMDIVDYARSTPGSPERRETAERVRGSIKEANKAFLNASN